MTPLIVNFYRNSYVGHAHVCLVRVEPKSACFLRRRWSFLFHCGLGEFQFNRNEFTAWNSVDNLVLHSRRYWAEKKEPQVAGVQMPIGCDVSLSQDEYVPSPWHGLKFMKFKLFPSPPSVPSMSRVSFLSWLDILTQACPPLPTKANILDILLRDDEL